jgi:hypothetical protein
MHGNLPQDRRNFSVPGTPDYSGSQVECPRIWSTDLDVLCCKISGSIAPSDVSMM